MAPSCKVYPEVVPQRVREDARFGAELRLYDLLKEQLGYGWTLFYDVAWLGPQRSGQGPRDGQVDFIVAHPRKGILLIEVKGGRIEFDGPNRQWISVDRHDQKHLIDPFAQVRSSKYGLLEKLKASPSLRGKWIRLSYSVCFPGSARPKHAVTPDSPPEIIIGADDLLRLQPRIEEILAFGVDPHEAVFEHGDLIVPELTKLLAQSIELRNPLAVQSIDEHAEMIRLTESQMQVLSLLKRVRRAAIGGAAGSGKTFLAIEKARRLAGEGFRTLLACYTEPLAEFLRSVVGRDPGLDVLTVGELSRRLTPASSDQPIDLFDSMSVMTERPYDAIVVDEGQDLNADWWLALECCLAEGKESVFYVFHDTHQMLFHGGGLLPDGMTEYALEDNLRNTQSICSFVKAHYRGEASIAPRGPAGRKVEVISYASEHDLAQLLSKTINRLLSVERISATDLIVLTPRRIDRSILSRTTLTGQLKLTLDRPTDRQHVQYASIEEFKGLERLAAIVVELDEVLGEDAQRREALCYVAFSRPRNHLVLMGTAPTITRLSTGWKG